MESDVRDLIDSTAEEDEAEAVLGTELLAICTDRSAKERRGSASTRLSALLPYIDFGDAIQVLNRVSSRLPSELREGILGLTARWERLGQIRNRVAHSRPLEIDDLPIVVDFSHDLTQVPGWSWDRTLSVIAELDRDPSSVFGMNDMSLRASKSFIQNNLPPADFDETGFLGRRKQRADVTKALLGPWPVVSILGDGGMGKTSLALQVAYDLLDREDVPFDVIVWTTAKNATLTTAEIVRVEGAIQDSLGLFSGAASELAGELSGRDPIAEVLEYLETFRVLLILDNLETVLDDNVSEFLRGLPFGSRVLITSRIGVGTENPIKLQPLSVSEGGHLMRTLAKVRGVQALAALSGSEMDRLVEQMNCHPGQIKWFVSGVQAGVEPDSLIHNNELLLDYCMENVFDYLNPDARTVLTSMQVIPGSHTLAELAYLSDFQAPRLQSAILELTRTNFVAQVAGSGSLSGYALTDFAKRYLQKRHPVEPAERAVVQERHNDLYVAGGDLRDAHARDPYASDTIEIRSSGDFYAARCLRSALEAVERGDVDRAIDQCREAADLAPGYHEPHRVLGFVFETTSNYGEAYEAYERARDLAAESPYVHYFFGRFLCATQYGPREGLREIQTAANLDHNNPSLKLEVARAHLMLNAEQSALDICCSVLDSTESSDLSTHEAIDVMLSGLVEGSHAKVEKTDWAGLAELVESVLSTLESHSGALDGHDLDRLLLVERDLRHARGRNVVDYISESCIGFASRIQALRISADPFHARRVLGTVSKVNPDRGFAFAVVDGESYFVHASEFWQREYFDDVRKGAVVALTPGIPVPDKNVPALAVNWLR
ncbi:NB-ARC domain-containing protein [Nocardioides sp. NBC_00850]|uniref:NB-ARC domain-containing protein n=1 Tax=Nocardioides sp. NBC_00850 TaxID=2976001 RepID=UPI00387088B4|nr:NB-ARC domain-containing protein [Nocardioides sp. NBC_00850]